MSTQLRPSLSSGQREPASPRRRTRRIVVAAVALAVLGGSVLAGAAVRNPPTPETAVPADRSADLPADAPADSTGQPVTQLTAYLPYWQQPAALADLEANQHWLTTAAPWWYSPTPSGDVVEQHPEYTDTGEQVVERIRATGVQLMPAIANHRNGAWDFEVVPRLLADADTRRRHVDALVELVTARDYDGIIIDYELLGVGDRENFTAFVTALGDAMHAVDRRLAVALHAQDSDAGAGPHNQAQDYAAIGAAADEIHLMTFDQHYDESEPGPVAPLPWVVDVVAYAKRLVPAEKLILGIGLFGYDWGGGDVADDLQLTQVRERIATTGAQPRFDRVAASPQLRYRRNGVDHEIWYEDARSVAAKLALVEREDLGGAFFWRLGSVPDAIWRGAQWQLDRP
jgi:spore germination protein YaaH